MCIALPVRAAPPSYNEEDDAPGNFFDGAKYDTATSHAVGVSMLTWGLGIAAGITALTLLIDQSSKGHSHHSSGKSSHGSSSHSHS
ncbi:MAG: hypothetical protein KBC64_03340 [Simkaniaceae bacterium]|nr:hypothetical protein [Simkaniaceae bacterium]